jgi:hypothetical protein
MNATRQADFVKSAFDVFFFQHQSMLDYQRRMKEQRGAEQSGDCIWGYGSAVGYLDRGTNGPDTA